MSNVGGDDRLIPTWFTVASISLLGSVTLMALVVAVAVDGPAASSATVFATAVGGGLVAACAALLRRRHRVMLEPGRDGDLVIRSPWLISAGLLVSWAAVLANCATWVWNALTGGDGEGIGVSLLVLIGAVASLPDLVRLLTGRLYRWRITMSGQGVAYRGYRTSVLIPWNEVRRVRIQQKGPAGVRVEGRHGSFVAPAVAFTVPAEQIVEEIRGRSR